MWNMKSVRTSSIWFVEDADGQEDENELSRKKQDEEEGFVNVFSTGPASDAWVLRSLQPVEPPKARSQWAPMLGNDTSPPAEDDDNQIAFFVPPLLSDATEEQKSNT